MLGSCMTQSCKAVGGLAMLWELEDWGLCLVRPGDGAEVDWIRNLCRIHTVARDIAIDLGRCYALGCFYDSPV